MNNDKLVLKDGTEITLESSQGIGSLYVKAESKKAACALWEKFTKESLKEVTVKNSSGMIVGIYHDMVLDHISASENEDKTVTVTFSLRNKSVEEALGDRITILEAGQQTQDEAIDDLGQTMSDIVEGGEQ